MKPNIYEWIYLYFQRDEEALPLLIKYFRPITLSIISNRFKHRRIESATWNECVSLADSVLNDCINRCKVDQYPMFKALYRTSLNNRLIDRNRTEYVHTPEHHVDVLHLDCFVNDNMCHYISEAIADPRVNVHQDVIVKCDVEQKYNELPIYFTAYERQILEWKRLGYTTAEIADRLNVNVRHVRYILLKMKKWALSH